jgi:hypothetical protein
VTRPEGIWLHSHGMAEMGFVNYDVLRPAEAVTGDQFDLLRSVAFHIAEGASTGSIEPAYGAEPVELVDSQTFMKSAAPPDRDLRDPEDHSGKRVVCCDPAATGIVGRLLRGKNWRPSSLLSRGMTEGKHIVNFSAHATELMAVRAKECLPLLDPLRAEFEDRLARYLREARPKIQEILRSQS